MECNDRTKGAMIYTAMQGGMGLSFIDCINDLIGGSGKKEQIVVGLMPDEGEKNSSGSNGIFNFVLNYHEMLEQKGDAVFIPVTNKMIFESSALN